VKAKNKPEPRRSPTTIVCAGCLDLVFAGDWCIIEQRHIGTIPKEMGGGERIKTMVWHPGCVGKLKKEAEKP